MGSLFLTRSLAGTDLELNDPPLGEGIVALPMLVTNLMEGREPADDRLYDVPHRAETIAVRIALWNSVLFLGLLGVVITWCRRVYGTRPAWFAVGPVRGRSEFRRAHPNRSRSMFLASRVSLSALFWPGAISSGQLRHA